MVRIVSDQSEEDMRRRDTRGGLVWPLRELTANLLRIANGAGKAVELMRQLRALRVLRRSRPASCTSFSDVGQPVLRAINECPRIRANISARAVVLATIVVAAALLGPRQRTRSGSDYDGKSDRCLGEHGGVS
jgi:hypothetical protein